MATQLETTSSPALRSGPHFSASIAFLGLVIADFILKLGGFRRLHQIVRRWPISKKKLKNDQETIAGVCETVERAANYYVKHAWCLQRSAVTTCFLRTKGIHAQMVIGCRKMPFHGHAWVEVNDRVVNDNQMVQTFYLPLYRC